MAKILNLHGDDYLVLKMFYVYFFKSKGRLPLFEQKSSKTEKKSVENNWKTVQSTCWNNVL